MPEHLTRRERRHIESFRNIGTDIVLGTVAVNRDTCSGCKLCVPICAGSALEMDGKIARMVPGIAMCFSCGDCVAICPEGSIRIDRFFELRGAFRYLDRGVPEPPRRF